MTFSKAGLFPARFLPAVRALINAFKVSLEHTRAQANEELIEALHECELAQSAHFDDMEREWEGQLKPPTYSLLQEIEAKESKSKSKACKRVLLVKNIKPQTEQEMPINPGHLARRLPLP